jgi:hypothetical protein
LCSLSFTAASRFRLKVRPSEALAEQLIAFLAATTPGPDLEEEAEGDGYADDEPSLGASEKSNQERSWSLRENNGDDREQEDEHSDEVVKQLGQ